MKISQKRLLLLANQKYKNMSEQTQLKLINKDLNKSCDISQFIRTRTSKNSDHKIKFEIADMDTQSNSQFQQDE